MYVRGINEADVESRNVNLIHINEIWDSQFIQLKMASNSSLL